MEDAVIILSLLCLGTIVMYPKKSRDYDHLDGISVRRQFHGKRGLELKREMMVILLCLLESA